MDIRSCPFCGSAAILKSSVNKRGDDAWIVECEDCGCQTHSIISPEKAVEVWNRRMLPVHCRDCRKDGLLECPMVMIEHRQMVFINHDPEWFCGDGEEKRK